MGKERICEICNVHESGRARQTEMDCIRSQDRQAPTRGRECWADNSMSHHQQWQRTRVGAWRVSGTSVVIGMADRNPGFLAPKIVGRARGGPARAAAQCETLRRVNSPLVRWVQRVRTPQQFGYPPDLAPCETTPVLVTVIHEWLVMCGVSKLLELASDLVIMCRFWRFFVGCGKVGNEYGVLEGCG